MFSSSSKKAEILAKYFACIKLMSQTIPCLHFCPVTNHVPQEDLLYYQFDEVESCPLLLVRSAVKMELNGFQFRYITFRILHEQNRNKIS